MRAAVVGLLLVVSLCAGCAQDDARTVGADTKARATPTAEPTDGQTTEAPTEPVHRCAPGDLAPRVVQTGSVGSAPFVTVALRNEGTSTCGVAGYPRLTGPLLREERGAIYEREDPGVHAVALDPGASAVFHVGTGTAYDVAARTLTKLRFRLPGRMRTYVVPVHLETSRPAMRRIPVGVTALGHEE